MRTFLRALLIGLAVVLLAVLAAAGSAALALRSSLPTLDGRMRATGLGTQVTVTRDALGIPTVRGASRVDVARATGWLHAQDRFFQMDLARRRAAGELAALVGPRALPLDRTIRIHRFRAEAARAAARLQPADRALLRAYTEGVNAGLTALGARPFEYFLLRQRPEAWRDEDTLLVILSMFVTLQDPDADYETTLATMHELLPPEVVDFLVPRGTDWDSPVVGPAFAMPPTPGADVFDARARNAERFNVDARRPHDPRALAGALDLAGLGASVWGPGGEAIGSNNWVVAARLSSTGVPIVANDMHLGIRVPNTWYRVAMEWTDAAGGNIQHRLVGTTLPGVPALVTGSNTHVAWGFTNTYGDFGDIVMLEVDPADPARYKTPGGWRTFETFHEQIALAGAAADTLDVRWTIWGPVITPDFRGRPRAYRWVAHDVDRLAGHLTPIENATTAAEALDQANGLGTPGQNMVAGDESGHIGWSIYGSIPRRVGFDGQTPQSWSDGSKRWDGWLGAGEYPRVMDPPGGRIWTANARVVDGRMLATIGDGSYEVGSRARIIRERLQARDTFTPRDMLAIQLDTEALFLERWRRFLLDLLTPAVIAGEPERTQVRDLLEHEWNGTAAAESASYRFTRTFRDLVSDRVFRFLLAECYRADPTFTYTTVRKREGPLWQLVTERPRHLLDPRFDSWEEFLIDTLDRVIADERTSGNGDLRARTWSEVNPTAYRHPLSAAVPFLSRWLDMPYRPLPGDLYTPRVAAGAIGASERMIVSPGREAEGIMHMPTGQSGHPLSPFYANSHDAWVEGRATPLLPGAAVHTLTLTP